MNKTFLIDPFEARPWETADIWLSKLSGAESAATWQLARMEPTRRRQSRESEARS